MPKGPRGENRPADVIGAAVLVAKIATGEVEEKKSSAARSRVAKSGGEARARKLSQEERSKIAKIAAEQRWKR